jgi:hypothetical protein
MAVAKYLESRCCLHPEALSRFKKCFADRSLGYLIPPQTSAVGRRLKKRLQAIGVYRKNGHEHLRGCVVFPITDLNGQTVQLYGRRIADNPAGPRVLESHCQGIPWLPVAAVLGS